MPPLNRPDAPGARDDDARTANLLTVMVGLWLLVSPFFLAFPGVPAALGNGIAVGLLVLVFAGIRAGDPRLFVGLSWLNMLLGAWLILAPFVLEYWDVPRARWTHSITGVIVGALAAWSAAATPAPVQRRSPLVSGG